MFCAHVKKHCCYVLFTVEFSCIDISLSCPNNFFQSWTETESEKPQTCFISISITLVKRTVSSRSSLKSSDCCQPPGRILGTGIYIWVSRTLAESNLVRVVLKSGRTVDHTMKAAWMPMWSWKPWIIFLYFESVKVGNPGKRRHLWCVFFPAAPGMKSGGAWFEWIDRETAGGLTLYHVYVDVNGKVLPATTQIWPSHRSGTVGKLLARCKICWLHLVGSTWLPCGCWHGKSTRRWARRRPWWRGCPFWTPASINCLLFLLLFPAAKKLCGLSLCLCIYVTFFPW